MDQLKTDLLHTIAHEMKTPLTVMSGYAQLSVWQMEQHTAGQDTMKNLQVVQQEAQRLADLVNNLLSVSHEHIGETELQRVVVKELLDTAEAVCLPVLQKNNNEIQLTCDGCPDVLANQEMLLQVLINLTINANKHTKDDVIAIHAESVEDGWVRMEVRDHGSGIAPEDQPHIFERGFSRDGSNGLGLAICKDVVEAHGGTIDVTSNGECGTVFGFTIPCFEAAQKHSDVSEAPSI